MDIIKCEKHNPRILQQFYSPRYNVSCQRGMQYTLFELIDTQSRISGCCKNNILRGMGDDRRCFPLPLPLASLPGVDGGCCCSRDCWN